MSGEITRKNVEYYFKINWVRWRGFIIRARILFPNSEIKIVETNVKTITPTTIWSSITYVIKGFEMNDSDVGKLQQIEHQFKDAMRRQEETTRSINRVKIGEISMQTGWYNNSDTTYYVKLTYIADVLVPGLSDKPISEKKKPEKVPFNKTRLAIAVNNAVNSTKVDSLMSEMEKNLEE
jgi:hypothetical protein